MLTLEFNGWFQCRLATDPDPTDDPRGVSGWTFAFAGEPDLDRVIRFQQPLAPRVHGPRVAVTIARVQANGATQANHPLNGGGMFLRDDAKFEGRNGALAEAAHEPIAPFHLVVEGARGIRVERSDFVDLLNPADRARRQPISFNPNSAEVSTSTGIADVVAFRQQRRALLLADAEATTDPIVKLALNQRIDQIDDSLPGGDGDIRNVSLRFQVVYDHDIRGNTVITDPESAMTPGIDQVSPWHIRFWMGGWDADALCGYAKGVLSIPTT